MPRSQGGLTAGAWAQGVPGAASPRRRGLARRGGRLDGAHVAVRTTLRTVPAQLPTPLSRGYADWTGWGQTCPGGGHTASRLPWHLPGSSLCLSRALGHSSASRKQLCWAVGQAPPASSPPHLGRGVVGLPSFGQDAGREVLLLEGAPQPQRVPTPGGVWLACSPWHPCLVTLRLSNDRAQEGPGLLLPPWSGTLAHVATSFPGADWPAACYAGRGGGRRGWQCDGACDGRPLTHSPYSVHPLA